MAEVSMRSHVVEFLNSGLGSRSRLSNPSNLPDQSWGTAGSALLHYFHGFGFLGPYS